MINKALMHLRVLDRAGGKLSRAELNNKLGTNYSWHTVNRLRCLGYVQANRPGNPGAAGPPDVVITDLGRQYAHTGEHPQAPPPRSTLGRKVQPTTAPAPMPKAAQPPRNGPDADPLAEAVRLLEQQRVKLTKDLARVTSALAELQR